MHDLPHAFVHFAVQAIPTSYSQSLLELARRLRTIFQAALASPVAHKLHVEAKTVQNSAATDRPTRRVISADALWGIGKTELSVPSVPG